MSAIMYGVQFRCDLCGKITTGPDSVPVGLSLAPRAPEGWTDMTLLAFRFTDVYGAEIRHLCETCSALPMGEVAAQLLARLEQEKAVSHG